MAVSKTKSHQQKRSTSAIPTGVIIKRVAYSPDKVSDCGFPPVIWTIEAQRVQKQNLFEPAFGTGLRLDVLLSRKIKQQPLVESVILYRKSERTIRSRIE